MNFLIQWAVFFAVVGIVTIVPATLAIYAVRGVKYIVVKVTERI